MSDIADLSDPYLATKNWNDLSAMLTTNPLPPEPSPTLFEALPPEFLQPICAAHVAGCASAMGNNSQPYIPEPAAVPALPAYSTWVCNIHYYKGLRPCALLMSMSNLLYLGLDCQVFQQ